MCGIAARIVGVGAVFKSYSNAGQKLGEKYTHRVHGEIRIVWIAQPRRDVADDTESVVEYGEHHHASVARHLLASEINFSSPSRFRCYCGKISCALLMRFILTLVTAHYYDNRRRRHDYFEGFMNISR